MFTHPAYRLIFGAVLLVLCGVLWAVVDTAENTSPYPHEKPSELYTGIVILPDNEVVGYLMGVAVEWPRWWGVNRVNLEAFQYSLEHQGRHGIALHHANPPRWAAGVNITVVRTNTKRPHLEVAGKKNIAIPAGANSSVVITMLMREGGLGGFGPVRFQLQDPFMYLPIYREIHIAEDCGHPHHGELPSRVVCSNESRILKYLSARGVREGKIVIDEANRKFYDGKRLLKSAVAEEVERVQGEVFIFYYSSHNAESVAVKDAIKTARNDVFFIDVIEDDVPALTPPILVPRAMTFIKTPPTTPIDLSPYTPTHPLYHAARSDLPHIYLIPLLLFVLPTSAAMLYVFTGDFFAYVVSAWYRRKSRRLYATYELSLTPVQVEEELRLHHGQERALYHTLLAKYLGQGPGFKVKTQ